MGYRNLCLLFSGAYRFKRFITAFSGCFFHAQLLLRSPFGHITAI
jgi:hypothetical protein